MPHTIAAGIIKRLHVHQQAIRRAMKNQESDTPVCLVQTSKGSVSGTLINIKDKDGNVVCTLKQQLDKPLSCGARVFIETAAEIEIFDKN
jgi:hypothetical protein